MIMLLAVIDVGSNTLRMLIGSVRGSEVLRIYTSRSITRLAEGIREAGNLREENMAKSLEALRDFSRVLSEYGVDHVRAVGTSAFREAKNSKGFITKVYEECGIMIETITGMREAGLTAAGVRFGFTGTVAPSLIIDIGGGSTEWIVSGEPPDEMIFHGSAPFGVVNLYERFMKTDPPSPPDVSALNEAIDAWVLLGAWEGFKAPADKPPLGERISAVPFSLLIGTGGTLTTLASLDLGLKTYDHRRVHMHRITLRRLSGIRDALMSLPLKERQGMDGLECGRADLIIPGILLTIRLMEILGFDTLIVSDYGLLEGLLMEMHHEEGF
jgi:exopolyphosphatase/guanosine-5'-triphosphate,3'-diphosphate pyrophosphatase